MGIKIVSQPIGAPILAAASTAMAQANQRTAERQSEMWQQQVEHKYKTKALEEARTFEAKENDYNFGRQNALRPMTPGLKGNLRAASDWAKLQDEARNIYSGLTIDPRSPEAQERLKQIAEDMGMLESVNPDPSPEEAFDKGRIFLGPDGSRMGPDGMPYKTMPEGGSELWLDPKTGTYAPRPMSDAEKNAAKDKEAADKAGEKEAERAAKAKEKAADDWVKDQKTFANDERKRQLDALKDKTGDHTKDIAKINSEYQQRLESLNNYMQNYGLRQPETPAAPVDAQVPTGEQLVGGALGENFGMTSPGGGVLAHPAAAPPVTLEQMQKDAAEAQALADKGLVQEPDGTVRPATPAERGAAPAAPPAAVPGAAAPAPVVPDTVTPKQISDELNALMDQMKEAGKTINDLSDADRAYIDELVRRLKGA